MDFRPRLSRRDLDEVLGQVRGDPRSPLYQLDPWHLAGALTDALSAWSARVDLARASEELGRVHRLEVAALLRGAARRRAAVEAFGDLFPYEKLSVDPLNTWTARVVEELEILRLDHMDLPGAGRLARLLRTEPRRWPGAVDLAEAALLAEDGAAGRLVLGETLLAAGEPARAAEVFGTLVCGATGEDSAPRWRVFAGLACAHEGRGADRLALGACEAAAAEADCGTGALVAGLFLALATADSGRAHRAARALDERVGDGAGLGDVIARLRTRVEVGRGGLPWCAPGALTPWLDGLARRDRGPSAPGSPHPSSPASEVARALG